MNCPVCRYHYSDQTTPCPQCGTEISQADLTQLDRLQYVSRRIEEWGANGVLPRSAAIRALFSVQKEINDLDRKLGLSTGPAGAAVASVPAGTLPSAPPAVAPVAPAPTLSSAPAPEAAAAPQPAPASGPPVFPPATPTELRVPQFSWSEVGSYLLSERTLNGLLGLGALLILAAGVVISTINPTKLSPVPHLIAVVITALVFYGAGYAVRQKLQLERSGDALLAIGAAFVPLVVWTLGQHDFLGWETGTIWLVASTLCLPIYFATHALVRDRISALLVAVASGSEVLAITHQIGVPLEFGVSALVLLAGSFMLLSVRLPSAWKTLAEAFRWSAQVATPAVMLSLLASAFYPHIWTDVTRAKEGPNFAYAVGAAWWLGTAFYALSARVYRSRHLEYVAAWTLPVAYLFTLTKAPWPAAWYNVCLAVLAAAYILVGRRVLHLLAGTPRPSLQEILQLPAYQVGLALTVVAGFWPFASLLGAAITFALLAVLYGIAAFELRHRLFTHAAVFSAVTAFALELQRLQPSNGVRALAWAALGAGILICAELTARRAGEHRRPLVETVFQIDADRSLFASPLFAAGYLVVLVALGLALDAYVAAPGSPVRHLAIPLIAAFLLIVTTLVASAVARRAAPLLYLPGWLLLIPLTSGALLVAQHFGLHPTEMDWVRVLAVVAAGYLTLAIITERFGEPYARPIYLAAYALSIVAMLLPFPDRLTSVEVIGLGILMYAWSAWRAEQNRHASFTWLLSKLGGPDSQALPVLRWLFLAAATWLFPIWLLLLLSLRHPAPSWPQNGLVLAVLAPIYIAAGLRFRRLGREATYPWYVAGYAMSVLGPAIAIHDLHVFIAALAISIGLYASSATVSRLSLWLYPALTSTLILCLAVTYAIWPDVGFERAVLGLIPPVWLMFSAAYAVARERKASRFAALGSTPIDSPWCQPLLIVGTAGLAVSVAGSAASPGPGLIAALAAFSLMIGLSVLWRAEAATWAGLASAIVAGEQAFRLAGISAARQWPWWAASGFGAALLCTALRRETFRPWSRPLMWVSLGVSVVAVVGAADTAPALADQSVALTIAIAGLTLIAHGFNRRDRRFGYAGVAALLAGYMLELSTFKIEQPQAFVIPAGLYLLAIAYLEWRRGTGEGIKPLLEVTALVLLLGTSLLQAVGLFDVGASRYAYDTYLLVESVMVLGIGAMLKWRRLFFAGGLALVADVLIMLAAPLRTLNTWYLVAFIGLAMVSLVVAAERKRQQIPLWANAWQQRLESWS